MRKKNGIRDVKTRDTEKNSVSCFLHVKKNGESAEEASRGAERIVCGRKQEDERKRI